MCAFLVERCVYFLSREVYVLAYVKIWCGTGANKQCLNFSFHTI